MRDAKAATTSKAAPAAPSETHGVGTTDPAMIVALAAVQGLKEHSTEIVGTLGNQNKVLVSLQGRTDKLKTTVATHDTQIAMSAKKTNKLTKFVGKLGRTIKKKKHGDDDLFSFSSGGSSMNSFKKLLFGKSPTSSASSPISLDKIQNSKTPDIEISHTGETSNPSDDVSASTLSPKSVPDSIPWYGRLRNTFFGSEE